MITINNSRVAELSATLKPIQSHSDNQFWEMYGIAEEFVTDKYDYAFYYGYHTDFDGTFSSCVIDSAEEYQVLRFFNIHVFMDDAPIYNFYLNQKEHENEADWQDDEDYGMYDLQVKKVTETKQVWIDRHGKAQTIFLAEDQCNESPFVSIRAKQEWFNTPKVSWAILQSISDEHSDYCHTDEERILPTLRANYLHIIDKWQPDFASSAIKHGFAEKCIQFMNTLKVAIKHGYTLPTDRDTLSMYFDYLNLMQRLHLCMTEPRYICPIDLTREHDRLNELLTRQQETLARKRAEEREANFAEHHSYLFGIEFDNGHFHFQSLDSVEAYRVEGKIMHHCIYNANRYNNHDELALHISDMEGNRVATCSINVKTQKIVEIQPIGNDTGFYNTYGTDWKETNDYKEIWNVLCARMHTFTRKQVKPQDKQLKIA